MSKYLLIVGLLTVTSCASCAHGPQIVMPQGEELKVDELYTCTPDAAGDKLHCMTMEEFMTRFGDKICGH